MFKLIDLTIGSFAIVKASGNEGNSFPIIVHGFIQVVDDGKGNYIAVSQADKMSDELIKSNEVENLKEEAIKRTIEDIADEFGD